MSPNVPARWTVCLSCTALAVLLASGCAPRQSTVAEVPVAPPPGTRGAQPASTEKPVAATAAAENPVAPEKNPPGDIPDSQVFVTYTSPTYGYTVKAGEGWARSENGPQVKFVDKLDGEQVVISKDIKPPTVDSVKAVQVPALQRQGRAVRVQRVEAKPMPLGVTAICITYTANSEPNPVTGKKIRLDEATYYFFHQGRIAALTLWAPAGADNVDQWKLISESFRWR